MESRERFVRPYRGALLTNLKGNVLYPLIAVKIIIALYGLKNIIGSFW